MRQSGHQYYVDVCVHVDAKYSLTEAHGISEDLEKEINKIQPTAIVNVHVEPNNHK